MIHWFFILYLVLYLSILLWYYDTNPKMPKDQKITWSVLSCSILVLGIGFWLYIRSISLDEKEENDSIENSFSFFKIDFFAFFVIFTLFTFGFIWILLQGENIWLPMVLFFVGLFFCFFLLRTVYPNMFASKVNFVSFFFLLFQRILFSFEFWFSIILIFIFYFLLQSRYKIPHLETIYTFIVILTIISCIKYFFFPFSAIKSTQGRVFISITLLCLIFAVVFFFSMPTAMATWVYATIFVIFSILFTLLFDYSQKYIVLSIMAFGIFLSILFGLNLQRISSSTTQLLLSIIFFFIFIRSVNHVYNLLYQTPLTNANGVDVSTNNNFLANLTSNTNITNLSSAISNYFASNSQQNEQSISSGIILIFWVLLFVFYFVISKTLSNPSFLSSPQKIKNDKTTPPKYKPPFVGFISFITIFIVFALSYPFVMWTKENVKERLVSPVQFILLVCGLLIWMYIIFNQHLFNSVDLSLIILLLLFCTVFVITLKGKLLAIFYGFLFFALWLLIFWLISLMQHKLNEAAVGGMSFVVIVLILLSLPLLFLIFLQIDEKLSDLLSNRLLSIVCFFVFLFLILFYLVKVFTVSSSNSNQQGAMAWTDKVCTVLFICMLIYLFVKIYKNSEFVTKSNIFSLLTNIIEYIPCLLDDLFVFVFQLSSQSFNYLKSLRSGNATFSMQQNAVSIVLVLIVVSMTLYLYFRKTVVKKAKDFFINPNILTFQTQPTTKEKKNINLNIKKLDSSNLNRPHLALNQRQMIWRYENLFTHSSQFENNQILANKYAPSSRPIYNFGISFWLFLKPTGGPDVFIPIMSLMGNMRVEVNLHSHTVRIVVLPIKEENEKNNDFVLLFQTNNPALFQNWSFWSINNTQNVFDVFVNAKLETSKTFVLDQKFENIFVGQSPSPIQGFIENISFSLTPFSIYQIYFNYIINSPKPSFSLFSLPEIS